MRPIERLMWNPRNLAHIARHDVTYQEVEEVLESPFTIDVSRDGRYELVGHATSARMLTVVVEHVEDGVYFVVTARPASRKERRNYFRAFGAGGEAS